MYGLYPQAYAFYFNLFNKIAAYAMTSTGAFGPVPASAVASRPYAVPGGTAYRVWGLSGSVQYHHDYTLTSTTECTTRYGSTTCRPYTPPATGGIVCTTTTGTITVMTGGVGTG